MAALPVVTQLQLLSKTGTAVDSKKGRFEAAALLESCKAMLSSQAARFIVEAGNRPLLLSYSNDGTPCKSRHKVEGKDPAKPEKSFTRSGFKTPEVLVQQVFLRRLDPAGGCTSKCLMREPLALTEGKSGAAIFAVSQAWCPLLRDQGHSGICIGHYCFDGALCSYLSRLFRARHMKASVERSGADREKGLDPEEQYLKEWVVATQCCAHMAHNALKWAVWELYPSGDFLEDLWAVLRGLKGSVGQLHSHLGQWIALHVAFVDPMDLPTPAEAQPLWNAMGLKEELQTLVAVEWQLVWRRERLCVSSRHEGDTGILAKLTDLFLKCLTIETYSKSRWMSVAKSCRSLCLSRMLGLDDLVGVILGKSDGQDWHLKHYTSLFEEERMAFVTLTALAGQIPDASLRLMLADSRATTQVFIWEAASREELALIGSWDMQVWQGMHDRGLIGEVAPRVFQGRVIHAGLNALAFLESECYRPALMYPWYLAQGDVDANLRALQTGPEATEETTFKIQKLLKRGYNYQQIKSGVLLLREVPWGTVSTEQAHASVTLVKRQHPQFELESIVVRAGIHTLRKLLPQVSPEEKALAKLQQALARLRTSQTRKITGKNLFMKSLIQALKDRADRNHARLSQEQVTKVVKKHGMRWRQLTDEQRAPFEREAEAFALEKTEAQALEEADRIFDVEWLALRDQDNKELQKYKPLLYSTCQWSEEDLRCWQGVYEEMLKKTYDEMVAMRVEAQQVPKPLTEEEEKQLLEWDSPAETAPAQRPAPWVWQVAQLRDQLRPFGLKFVEADGSETIVKVLFAKQNRPLQVHTVRLTETRPMEPAVGTGRPSWVEEYLVTFRYTFTMSEEPDLLLWQDLPQVPIDQVWVLPQLTLRPGYLAVSDSEYVPLQTCIDQQEYKPRKTKGEDGEAEGRRRPVGPSRRGLAGMSATQRLLGERDTPAGAGGSGKNDEPEEGAGEVPKDWNDDSDLESLFDRLEHERGAGVGVAPTKLNDFQVALRGGASEERKTGRPYSGWQGQVRRGGEAHEWCRLKAFQSTKHFKMELGDEAAWTLAMGWAQRMQYMWDCHQEGLLANPDEAAECMLRYDEAPEFQDLAIKGSEEVKAAVAWIRALEPR